MNPILRFFFILSGIFPLSFSLAAQPAAEPEGAEYAMRWDIAEGGPQSAKDVLKALGKKADQSEDYEIQYFDFTDPGDTSDDVKAILRQRKRGEKHDLTFKYRGDHPLSGPECPLSPAAKESREEKQEVDVSILAGGKTKKTYSYSCTLKSKEGPINPPQVLKATPKPCGSRMTRLTENKLKVKVEEWHLPGGVTLVEVSRNGSNKKKDQESFQKEIVDKLLKAGVQPSDRSKTELGSDCQ